MRVPVVSGFLDYRRFQRRRTWCHQPLEDRGRSWRKRVTTVEVDCDRETHRLTAHADGSVRLEDHDLEAEAVLTALAGECRGCMAVARAWRLGQVRWLPHPIQRPDTERWVEAGLNARHAVDFAEAARQAVEANLGLSGLGSDNPVDEGIRWSRALGHIPSPEEIRCYRAAADLPDAAWPDVPASLRQDCETGRVVEDAVGGDKRRCDVHR